MMLQSFIRNSTRRDAFSLVELSIVLVILGLLVGGVLAGQSLIRAAQLRNVTTEYQNYRTAIGSFRDKYFQLPGDMTNATSFWGTADGGDGIGSDCRDAQTNDQRTCNGNGDASIGVHPDFEYARMWQHLSNARLIEGSTKGTGITAVTGCNPSAAGCVYPGTKSGQGIWQVRNLSPSLGLNYSYYDTTGNALYLSTVIDSTGNVELGPTFTPEEAWNIDKKLDDGKPGTGFIMATRPFYCDDNPSSVDFSNAARTVANYQLSSKNVSCVLFFTNFM